MLLTLFQSGIALNPQQLTINQLQFIIQQIDQEEGNTYAESALLTIGQIRQQILELETSISNYEEK